LGNTRRLYFDISYQAPFSEEERNAEQHQKKLREVSAMIAYYEMSARAQQNRKEDELRNQRGSKLVSSSPTTAGDLRHLLIGDAEMSEEGRSMVRAKDTMEYYSDFSTSWSEDSRDAFGTSEETPTKVKKRGKLFPVNRKFSVRRVDDLSTMRCSMAGKDDWRPQPYVCFPSLEHEYATNIGRTSSRSIDLPRETYRWIPIWLFPFVLRMCPGDALYKAMGGTESITFFVDMFDAAIVHAATSKSVSKGAIPVGTAKLCRSLMRTAAEFFEIEQRVNVQGSVKLTEKALSKTLLRVDEHKALFRKQVEINTELKRKEVSLRKEVRQLKEIVTSLKNTVEGLQDQSMLDVDMSSPVRKRKSATRGSPTPEPGRKKARRKTRARNSGILLEGGLLDL
jgi:hypothetical protein